MNLVSFMFFFILYISKRYYYYLIIKMLDSPLSSLNKEVEILFGTASSGIRFLFFVMRC